MKTKVSAKDQQRKPHVLNVRLFFVSVLVALGCAIPLSIAWFFIAMWLYFGNGGNFGGYGAAAADAEPWVKPVQWIVLLLALAFDIWIAKAFYFSRYQRSSR